MMNDPLQFESLLRARNRCLELIIEAGDEFLQAKEENEESKFSRLSLFEQKRKRHMEALARFNREMERQVQLISNRLSDQQLQIIRSLAERNDQLILDIEALDLKIRERMVHLSEEVLRTLKQNHKDKTMVSKFKSQWVTPSGEGLDTKL